MTPVWQSVLAAAALATAGLAIALARLAGRARSASDALSRRIDDLSSQLSTLEAGVRQARLAADPSALKGAEQRKIHRFDSAARLIAVPSLATAGSDEAATEAGAELGRRFGLIWAMADAGEPVASIARKTGHPIGQVELILGLRRPAVPVPVPFPGEAASHD